MGFILLNKKTEQEHKNYLLNKNIKIDLPNKNIKIDLLNKKLNKNKKIYLDKKQPEQKSSQLNAVASY